MEFEFNCEKLLNCDKNGFGILEGTNQEYLKHCNKTQINEIIDKIGYASSKVKSFKKIKNRLKNLIISSQHQTNFSHLITDYTLSQLRTK